MLTDPQGYPLPGATTDALAHYDRAIHAFNIYRGDPIALLDQAISAAPGFAMAQLAKAFMLGLATEPAATAAAREMLEPLAAQSLSEREASHLNALRLLLDGQWSAAAVALDHHSACFPRDIVALQAGHLMDFYRANARNLRDRIARVLPQWSSDVPGYSIAVGMYAFGLEECGDYARAEDEGRRALSLQPLDCWAHHAVAHVMEMQGRAEDGIGWMNAREPCWSGADNVFKVHNWWHLALCHLNLGQTGEALALYDGAIRVDHSAVALDLVDATALLWRLHLTGCAVGERWQEVAQSWDSLVEGSTYPFNDWHAAMAYLGAGREADVERILSAMRRRNSVNTEAGDWALQSGCSLVEGFSAFWHGDYQSATEVLHRCRFIVNGFGGSHAQRDVIDWTLTEAAVRGGNAGLARSLANERLALRPFNPVNQNFLLRANGMTAGAAM